MSIQDIIKKSFINQINSASISTTDILTVLLVTAAIGIYIFFIYRLVCRKAFYSRAFAISLVVIAMVTSIIIITVQASVVISLGMVGALSIVRFRTAIKDPMDLAFLFWTISVGIICGAGLYEVALEGTFMITVVIFILHMIPDINPALLLIINATDVSVESEIEKILADTTRHHKIKSRNVTTNGIDMIIELKTKEERILIEKMSEISQIQRVTLMSHDGEVTY